jgi:nucleolar protein 4
VVDPAPEAELTHWKVANDGCPPGPCIFVTYKTVKAAMEAVTKLHKCTEVKGTKFPAPLWARQLGGEGAHVKKWRLIVRNLAWKVRETLNPKP